MSGGFMNTRGNKHIRQLFGLATAAAAAVLVHGVVRGGALAQSGNGTIQGHVKLTGTPPPNAVIKMMADPNCYKMTAGKTVEQQTVVRAADGGLANVFVNVKGSFPNA